MRCFIAVNMSDGVVAYLRQLQQQLPRDAKLHPANDFHLTLKFLGEVTPAVVEKVKSSLHQLQYEKFVVETAGIGVFPSEDYVRVVWMGLQPEGKIQELQQLIDDALKECFRREKDFRAHVTLARVKYVEDGKSFVKKLRLLPLKKEKTVIDKIVLKKSTITPAGHVYDEVMAAWLRELG